MVGEIKNLVNKQYSANNQFSKKMEEEIKEIKDDYKKIRSYIEID
jgi:hypothetical protein